MQGLYFILFFLSHFTLFCHPLCLCCACIVLCCVVLCCVVLLFRVLRRRCCVTCCIDAILSHPFFRPCLCSYLYCIFHLFYSIFTAHFPYSCPFPHPPIGLLFFLLFFYPFKYQTPFYLRVLFLTHSP